MALFSHSIANLVMAECASASPMFRLWFVWTKVFKAMVTCAILACNCTKCAIILVLGGPALQELHPLILSHSLNWSTSSSAFPFIHVLVDGLGWMLLMKIQPLSHLISMVYPLVFFSNLFKNYLVFCFLQYLYQACKQCRN